jgi:hypothetical protein
MTFGEIPGLVYAGAVSDAVTDGDDGSAQPAVAPDG